MRECKNPTCTAQTKTTYCSRRCQVAMRTVTKGSHLGDVWVSQDLRRKISRIVREEGWPSVSAYVISVLEEDVMGL